MSDIRYFGHYDSESGEYFGFYPTDLYPDIDSIPTPNIELTFDEWQTAIGSRHIVVNGVSTPYVKTTEEQLDGIKRIRTRLLSQSDWVVLPHSPITGSKLDEWIVYRQSLRDITSQTPPYVLPTQPE
jgi:hypothetical protein